MVAPDCSLWKQILAHISCKSVRLKKYLMLIYLFQFVKHLKLLQGTPLVDFGGPCGQKSASVSTIKTIKNYVKNKTVSGKMSSCFFLTGLHTTHCNLAWEKLAAAVQPV